MHSRFILFFFCVLYFTRNVFCCFACVLHKLRSRLKLYLYLLVGIYNFFVIIILLLLVFPFYANKFYANYDFNLY